MVWQDIVSTCECQHILPLFTWCGRTYFLPVRHLFSASSHRVRVTLTGHSFYLWDVYSLPLQLVGQDTRVLSLLAGFLNGINVVICMAWIRHLANIPPFCVLLLQIQAIVEEQRRFPKEHRIGFCNVFSIKGRVKEKKKTGKYQRIGNCLFIKLLEIFTLTKNIKNDNYLIDKIIKLFWGNWKKLTVDDYVMTKYIL